MKVLEEKNLHTVTSGNTNFEYREIFTNWDVKLDPRPPRIESITAYRGHSNLCWRAVLIDQPNFKITWAKLVDTRYQLRYDFHYKLTKRTIASGFNEPGVGQWGKPKKMSVLGTFK